MTSDSTSIHARKLLQTLKTVIVKVTGTAIKNFPTNRSSIADGFYGEFYQTLQKELISIRKLFQKILEKVILANLLS